MLYDSEAILQDFTKRKNITFPLLSDPGAKAIRAFGVLNTYVPQGHMWYGVPFPGTFIVDHEGVVRSKYFEERYQERYSAPTILLREFGSTSGTREVDVDTDHLRMKYFSTRDVVRPNLRFTLVANIEMKPKMHVYAPGTQGYIPIKFEIDPSPNFSKKSVVLPNPENLFLAPIKQTVPVYRGKLKITQDVVMGDNNALQAVLNGSHEVRISGHLRYQACDDMICYLPQDIPLEWVLKVEPQDRERVPEAIQHK